MLFPVRKRSEKWRFVIAVSVIATIVSLIITYFFTPPVLMEVAIRNAFFIPPIIALPIASWTADRLMQIHALNVGMAHMIEHDQMTNLLTRGHFFRLLETMQPDVQGAILMVDIDKFKNINDTFGHHAGDVMIKHVAAILKEQSKPDGLAARFGGEEFLVFLPQADAKSAMSRAEALRQEVQARKTDVDGRRLGCTVSIGVDIRMLSENLDVVLRRADAALYTAKHKGRNQVVMAQELGTSTPEGSAVHELREPDASFDAELAENAITRAHSRQAS